MSQDSHQPSLTLVWMGGFLGDTIVWRDRKCTVLRDGRLHVNT